MSMRTMSDMVMRLSLASMRYPRVAIKRFARSFPSGLSLAASPFASSSQLVASPRMVEALLSSFDGRFWIPISNILLRLVRGSGFGQHREGGGGGGGVGAEECSSQVFQRLLCATCEGDAKLLSGFLNRIFNTLNWTITEFSVAMKEMNHAITKRQANDLQHHQRKCTIMFELSVNLERILEFLTLHLWHVFLDADAEMNLTRLCESLVFLLNHTTCGPDARLFESTLQLQMQQLEKISRALILAPCVGIILNLHRAATARDGGGGGGGA